MIYKHNGLYLLDEERDKITKAGAALDYYNFKVSVLTGNTAQGLPPINNPYMKVSGTNVRADVHRSLNNYSTKMEDGMLSNVDLGFIENNISGSGTEKELLELANRDIRSYDYIGLNFSDDDKLRELWEQVTLFPMIVYREPNTYKNFINGEADYYTKLVNRYKLDQENQLSSIRYKIGTAFIDIEKERKWQWNNHENKEYSFDSCYINGDCFMSRYSFRQCYNGKSYEIYLDDDGNPESNHSRKHYNHGTLFSIVLQSDINTGLRGQGTRGFYPLWASDWKKRESSNDFNSVLCARFGGGLGVEGEEFIYDFGHSETLPLLSISGSDEIYKDRELHHSNRVRWTDKHMENAFTDAWRSIYFLSKVDYSALLGNIMIITSYGNSIIIVTTRGISQLYPEERALGQTETGQDLVLGTGPILSDHYRDLADYGSQHKSFIKTDSGIYGFDLEKSKFWQVMLRMLPSGAVLGANEISRDISSFILARKEYLSKDAIVRMGLDEKEDEVLLTLRDRVEKEYDINIDGNRAVIDIPEGTDKIDFNGYATFKVKEQFVNQYGKYIKYPLLDEKKYSIDVTDKISLFYLSDSPYNKVTMLVNYGYTLNYAEKISNDEIRFITRVGISPDIYMSLNDILSTNDRLFDVDRGKVWFHDNKAQKHVFYGFNSWFKYGVVINNSQEGRTDIQAIFNNIALTSDKEVFDVVEFETETQECRLNPFYDEDRFWLTPEYSENKWVFTVPEALITKQDWGYEADSNMRGIWMKMMLTYKGEKEKYIGEIISKNVLSFN